VANLLAGSTVTHFARHGYFWSDQYGRRLPFAGVATEDVRIFEGDVVSKRFVATYHRDDVLTGVFAIDSPRPFTRLRRALQGQKTLLGWSNLPDSMIFLVVTSPGRALARGN